MAAIRGVRAGVTARPSRGGRDTPGWYARGASVRAFTEDVTVPAIPDRCVCSWTAVAHSPTGPEFKGWRLKFRHTECPAKIRGDHG
jgi:hypothetical protein